jgi:PAS domain S-box-containing protein
MNTQQLLQESERSRLALLSILEDQKRVEENLRKSEAYNRLLFNSSIIGLALCKMDGSLVDVNPAYAILLGRTIEETLNLTYWDITPKKYEEQEKQQLKSLEETGRYGPYEKEYIHKDGHLVPVRLQGLIFEQEGERFIWSSVEDISDRKKAEEAQRESEARYRKFVETEPECVKVLTKDNILQDMNPAGLAMIEADSREQVVGKSVMGFINPEYKVAFNDLVQRVFLGESGILEFKITGLKGTIRWLETHAVPMRDDHGSIHSLLSITRDITERRRAEQALMESENRFRRLAENAQDMIYRMSFPGGKYEYVSPAAVTLFGYTPEEFYNTPVLIQKVIHPDWHKYFEEQWANLIKGEMPPTYEYQIIHKSGEVRWVNQRNILVRDDVGKPIAIEGIVTDITERKLAEETLRESEEKYRSIFDNVRDCIYTISPEGILMTINPEFEPLTGWSVKEWLGKSFTELVHPDDLPKAINVFQKIMSGEKVEAYELRILTKSGEYRIGEFTPSPSKSGDKIVGALGIARNITERKRAEDEILQRANQLATLLTASQALAATLDLTTILQTITESAAEIMQIGTTAIYLLEGENLYLGATTPPLPLQFPETFRHASLADHPHIQEAVITGLPVIIPDAAIAQLTKAERAVSDARGLRTILYIPLIVGEKTVGTLILGTVGVTRNFTESQIDLCRTLSNQAAIAIENARLLNEIRQRNKEMNILDSIIKSTTTRLELQSILDKALEGAIALTGLEGGTLCLVDNEKKVLDLSAAYNTSKEMFDELSASAIGIGDCLCGKAAQTGEPIILWDNASGSEYATHESVRNEGIRFHAAFPLIAGGKTLGVLCVFARNEFKPTKQSLEMLNELCGTVALAIENARLYEDVKKHTLQLENIVSDRTAELQISNKELEAFSYSVAHDLRAPLRAIDGFSLALLEDYTDKLDKEGKHHLHRVRDGAKEMAQLIDDLLNLSRISRRELIRGTVDMSKIVKSIEEKFIASEAVRKVKFSVADNIQVQGDNQLLKIVMENLLNNAWKFTSKRKNTKIEFGVLDKEGKNVYYIRDNGVGFDMKYADKLFNPFQRLHRKEDYPGTGIGLATVKRIISKHGGSVWAESELGKGAAFYFTI